MTDNEYRALFEKSPADAQNTLYEEYLNYVYSIVFKKLRICARAEDIEECVSDVFTAVFLSYDSKQSINGDLKGYIGRIASNKAINMFHSLTAKKNNAAYIEELETQPISEDTVADNAERKELRDNMIKCIQALGEPEASMMIQKYYYNMRSYEIGKMLSMPAGTVRVRCNRALKKLKAMLEDKGFELKEERL